MVNGIENYKRFSNNIVLIFLLLNHLGNNMANTTIWHLYA